jgi:hypothetical protein
MLWAGFCHPVTVLEPFVGQRHDAVMVDDKRRL